MRWRSGGDAPGWRRGRDTGAPPTLPTRGAHDDRVTVGGRKRATFAPGSRPRSGGGAAVMADAERAEGFIRQFMRNEILHWKGPGRIHLTVLRQVLAEEEAAIAVMNEDLRHSAS